MVHSTARPFVYSPWVQPRRHLCIMREHYTPYNARPASKDKIDHDRLFNELIRVFFRQFMELFFPKVHVEDQVYKQRKFNDRMFVYFSRLYEKHRMKYTKTERVEVKKKFLRMLVRLRPDPARMQLTVGFFDQYLKLNDEEEKQLKEEIQKLNPQETEEIFRIETSWERKGKIEGKIEVARRMLASGMILEDMVPWCVY